MSILTQGTQVYFIDPDDNEIVEVECATAFNAGGAPRDQIEDTCLKADEASYKKGLRRPGQAQLTINADPNSASHIRLHELYEEGVDLNWAVGWSDGTDVAPAVDSDGNFDLPESRTWYVFRGYVSDFPFDFQGNTVVSTVIPIQRKRAITGAPAGWYKKEAS